MPNFWTGSSRSCVALPQDSGGRDSCGESSLDQVTS